MIRKSKRRKKHQDAKRRRAARRRVPAKFAGRNGATLKAVARKEFSRNGVAPTQSTNGERRNQLAIVATSAFPPCFDPSSFRRLPVAVAPPAPSNRILDFFDDLAYCDELATFEPDLSAGRYREIRFGELLNYTRDPLAILRRAREWVAPDGVISASFANARHFAIVGGLLEGHWNGAKRSDGAPSPVRFYTRREIEKLFYRAGYRLSELCPIEDSGLVCWRREGGRAEFVAGSWRIAAQSPHEAEEFHTRGYQVVAAPREVTGLQGTVGRGKPASTPTCSASKAEPLAAAQRLTPNGSVRPMANDHGPMTNDHGLTSIVIVTHNQLDYTKMCRESIRFLTDEPYELIVVDNGSTDGSIDYLRSASDVRLIENAENRGFPAAANQGIMASRGQQILLLNNDVFVTTGWLRRMLMALDSDPAIGLVGPCSNAVSGPQQVPVGYDDLVCLDGWAWDYSRQREGQLEETDRLVGFCLLFRRELVERVGLLDERFGIGNFEDDDFCLRARLAGYRAVIARDAFIHHFGHRTFAGSGVDLNALLLRNQKIFQEKWNGQGNQESGARRQEPVGSREDGFTSAPPSAPRAPRLDNPQSRHHHVSCCMIVRDNERTIAAAVTSILPWVGEVIVVDTGSKDRTAEICRQLGCKVYHFPWPDSFSVARNESLKYATGEWIFWFDSDDVIDAENGRKLAELLSRSYPENLLGFVMKVLCPSERPESEIDFTAVDHCKVFRNRPDLRFEGRIHEQVMEAINRANGDVAFTDLFVVHAGADHTPEGRRRKLRRDIKLLRLERRDRPNHPFLHFNLGMTYGDAGKHVKAIKALRRSLELAQPHESHVRKVYALLVTSYLALHQKDEASAACREGLRLYPKDPELLFRHGTLLHDDGRLRQAELSYLAALANDDEPHFSSFDYGIVGHKTRHNLAGVYKDMGALHKAEEQWKIIIAQVPSYREGWTWRVENLLMQGKLAEAQEIPIRLLNQQPALAGTAVVLAARVVQAVGDLANARRILEQGVRECPNDSAPLEALCELLFFHAHPLEAEAAVAELARRQPEDAGAQHNLGTVLMRLGRPQEAVKAFQASVRHRPDAASTHLSLGYALHNAGRDQEARLAFERCLRLAPGEPTAAEAARQLHALAA